MKDGPYNLTKYESNQNSKIPISLLFFEFGEIWNIVTRNNIVWKLVRGYSLCYCKTFSLVPDSPECTKILLPNGVLHYLCHLKLNNIIGEWKTTNKEKHFYS